VLRKKRQPIVILAFLVMSIVQAQAQQTCGLYSLGTRPSFDPLAPGAPGLIAEGPDQSLYTTSAGGGTYNRGTVFKFTPAGTVNVVHNFDIVHGQQPQGGLTRGKDGNFYGTTYAGGERSVGTIFSITPEGQLSVLYSFKNGYLPRIGRPYTPQELLDAAGSYPTVAPVQGKDGNLYGVTSYANNQKYGVFYRMGSGGYRGLYFFDGSVGNFPNSLTAGRDGNLYGTTFGGLSGNPYGAVFKADIAGGVSQLYRFDRIHGARPTSVIQGSDPDGSLYGTTANGGIAKGNGYGVVFKLTLKGEITILHQFSGADGISPLGGLVEGPYGYLYGTTYGGGAGGRGTIFRVSKTGSDLEVLHSFVLYKTGRYALPTIFKFPNDESHQQFEQQFFGVTARGGARDYGEIYRMTLPRTNQPHFEGGTLERADAVLEVRKDVKGTQVQNEELKVLTEKGITIQVKCSCGHIVQFIHREFFDKEGKRVQRWAQTSWGNPYSTTLKESEPNWVTDSIGRPSPYYESSMSFRTDPDSMTTIDEPNFAGTLRPVPAERSRATFKSYAICNGDLVRELNWYREQKGGLPPTYSVDVPRLPNTADWAKFKALLTSQGYDANGLP
jgi:uncharacterized repeat protein (TIGR03803 family)